MAQDNYYPETESDPAPDAPDKKRDNSEKADVETTLVPLSFLGGDDKEVGSVCKVKIVAIYDGEAEIEYVKHDAKKDKPDRDDDDEGEMSIADSMMGAEA